MSLCCKSAYVAVVFVLNYDLFANHTIGPMECMRSAGQPLGMLADFDYDWPVDLLKGLIMLSALTVGFMPVARTNHAEGAPASRRSHG